MEIIIREIKEQDYDNVLFIGNHELNCHHTIEDLRIHYHRIKDDDRYQTFVALEQDNVIGFISSVCSYEIGEDVGFMHITGLAVQKDKQNQGIGKKLLAYMENYAKDKGISKIILNSHFKRTDAHAFYQHNGYNNTSWCFLLMICYTIRL